MVVTDVNGCKDSISVDITEPPAIPIDVDPAGPYAPTDGLQTMSGSPAGGTWSAD